VKNELPEDVGDLPPDLASEVKQELIDNPTGWMEDFMLSQDEIDEMLDAEFLVPDMVIRGQINVIAGKAGCGKTTILNEEIIVVARRGFDVLYVNMDCGAADVKYWRLKANEAGFKLITPHFQGGGGIDAWLARTEQMVSADVDLSSVVIVIDTLKKITDLMSKSKAKKTMSMLRALTAKQCTVVAAAHCNKHRTPDGKLVFEGVGDIENDCDNLVYLEGGEKDELGTKIVTVEPSDKVRGLFNKRSWQLKEDRSVISLDVVVDVAAKREVETQMEKDATAIDVIKEGISENKHKRVELFQYAKDRGISKREFDRVIMRYCRGKTDAKTTPLWRDEKQATDNASYYILLKSAPSVTAIIRDDRDDRNYRDYEGE
jgi:AAA domain